VRMTLGSVLAAGPTSVPSEGCAGRGSGESVGRAGIAPADVRLPTFVIVYYGNGAWIG